MTWKSPSKNWAKRLIGKLLYFLKSQVTHSTLTSRVIHTVWIPPHHRDLTAGAERVEAHGDTIRAVLADLDAHFPGLAERLAAGQKLRPGIAVAVDGVVASAGLRHRLAAPSEIHFVPALAGG